MNRIDRHIVEAQGQKSLIAPIPATQETVATICYTSVSELHGFHTLYLQPPQGTTNTPKGMQHGIYSKNNVGLSFA
jgi:hypothetical protein